MIFVREFYTLFPHFLEATCPLSSAKPHKHLTVLLGWVDVTSDYISLRKGSYVDKPQINGAGTYTLPTVGTISHRAKDIDV